MSVGKPMYFLWRLNVICALGWRSPRMGEIGCYIIGSISASIDRGITFLDRQSAYTYVWWSRIPLDVVNVENLLDGPQQGAEWSGTSWWFRRSRPELKLSRNWIERRDVIQKSKWGVGGQVCRYGVVRKSTFHDRSNDLHNKCCGIWQWHMMPSSNTAWCKHITPTDVANWVSTSHWATWFTVSNKTDRMFGSFGLCI